MRRRVRFAALAAAIAALLVAPAGGAASFAAQSGNWVEAGFDAANTLNNPGEVVLTTANVAQLVPSWNLAAAAGGAPTVVDGHVYVESVSAVNAFDATTGDPQWSFPITGTAFFSHVAVAGGVVYALQQTPPTLFAIDAATGTALWKLKVADGCGAPVTVVAGIVYVGSCGDSRLTAVDTSTHKVKWSFAADGQVGRPAVVGGHVYLASFNGKVYSLDEATGAFQWSVDLGSVILEDPSVANGIIYIGTKAGIMYALDASNGSEDWHYQTGDTYTTDAAIANGTVYFGAHDTYLYALKAKTGRLRWKFKTGKPIITNPTIANGVVYLSSYDKFTYALDAATGAKLWSFLAGSSPLWNIAVSNGSLYCGYATGHLRRFTLPA
jgi:eukaryotic-like serine/threonine-protein kinase